MVSSNPHQYTAQDCIGWERYATQLCAFLNGTAPFPGDPPEGYREVFRLSQPWAPVPEEYSSRVMEALRNGDRRSMPRGPNNSGQSHAPPATDPDREVSMSSDAFNALLGHATTMQNQFFGYLQALQAQSGSTAVVFVCSPASSETKLRDDSGG
ncbi:hypothetical protein FOMPIDRAFT_1050264 [Fomitopsis schrenkii]|uniref:Uncharacterized protein n=1 Tax=Fomitopsis schrenkii TaxID=2126942 RepID=S8FEK2_FOMSC|nr:hypothetical protein FOMPIDRAFT_1050264 [Fomitopsis schrenkii]